MRRLAFLVTFATVASVGAGAALLILPGAAAGEDVSLIDVPNVSFDYYDVPGRTTEELAQSLHLLQPTDPNDGQRVIALTSWTMGYSWPESSSGACDLGRATLHFQASVRFPRLARPDLVEPQALHNWQRFSEALRRHEARHVRYAWDHRGDVLRAVRASSCSDAEANGKRAIAQIVRHDIRVDRDTRHGATEGVFFP